MEQGPNGSADMEMGSVNETESFSVHHISQGWVASILQIAVIKLAKDKGLPVTCEVCPHHLFLTLEQAKRHGVGRCSVKPSLVTQEDIDALWENMSYIDCFATDHG